MLGESSSSSCIYACTPITIKMPHCRPSGNRRYAFVIRIQHVSEKSGATPCTSQDRLNMIGNLVGCRHDGSLAFRTGLSCRGWNRRPIFYPAPERDSDIPLVTAAKRPLCARLKFHSRRSELTFRVPDCTLFSSQKTANPHHKMRELGRFSPAEHTMHCSAFALFTGRMDMPLSTVKNAL